MSRGTNNHSLRFVYGRLGGERFVRQQMEAACAARVRDILENPRKADLNAMLAEAARNTARQQAETRE